MIKLLAYVEVPAAIADNPEAVAILTKQVTETGMDLAMDVGEAQVTESDVPGQKVVLWPLT